MSAIHARPTDGRFIAEAIFPGDDIYARLARSDFAEFLQNYVAGGGVLEFLPMKAAFAEFRPERRKLLRAQVPDSWELEDRVRMLAKLEAFLLGGGLLGRLEVQARFLRALRTAGLTFGNDGLLVDVVVHSGDWRRAFINLVVRGRDCGIYLSGNALDREAVAEAMRSADFTLEQRQEFWGNVGGMSQTKGC
ncbi:hypothetical protein [Rubrivivax gelatinosus]|uniref:hypothetical protein n=1 Tax=Rubrivivax gelatinosus TaxID=28068 RepID=UPI0005C1BFF9|nr:hypothetical protein [Rubrivivax gelatinosus]MBG6083104.1 hypothetical protein [Rubrivivax gelatinosus]